MTSEATARSRGQSRAKRMERHAALMAGAKSPRRRVALACQFAQSIAATLTPAGQTALARAIAEATEREAAADGDGE